MSRLAAMGPRATIRAQAGRPHGPRQDPARAVMRPSAPQSISQFNPAALEKPAWTRAPRRRPFRSPSRTHLAGHRLYRMLGERRGGVRTCAGGLGLRWPGIIARTPTAKNTVRDPAPMCRSVRDVRLVCGCALCVCARGRGRGARTFLWSSWPVQRPAVPSYARTRTSACLSAADSGCRRRRSVFAPGN